MDRRIFPQFPSFGTHSEEFVRLEFIWRKIQCTTNTWLQLSPWAKLFECVKRTILRLFKQLNNWLIKHLNWLNNFSVQRGSTCQFIALQDVKLGSRSARARAIWKLGRPLPRSHGRNTSWDNSMTRPLVPRQYRELFVVCLFDVVLFKHKHGDQRSAEISQPTQSIIRHTDLGTIEILVLCSRRRT